MVSFLRRMIRIILLLFWCLSLMLLAALSHLFVWNCWKRIRMGSTWAQIWALGASRIVGIRIRKHGNSHFQSGCLVISNHLGYLDILVHASVFSLRFAPKAEIKKWPFFGWLTALGHPVWIDRKNPRMSALYAEAFQETMAHGISMLVYPEGTSTDGKHGLLPFKSTPFASALKCNAPIMPTLLFYHSRRGGDSLAAWHDDTPFGTHLWRVLGDAGTDIDIYCLPPALPAEDEDRKALAARIHDIMETEYWKVENVH